MQTPMQIGITRNRWSPKMLLCPCQDMRRLFGHFAHQDLSSVRMQVACSFCPPNPAQEDRGWRLSHGPQAISEASSGSFSVSSARRPAELEQLLQAWRCCRGSGGRGCARWGGGVHQDVEEIFSTNSFKVYRWHDQKCAHGITFVEHALQLKLVRQAQANMSLPK